MTTRAFSKINKLILVLLTTLATAIGLTPWVLLVGRPWLLVFFTAGALLISGLTIRSFNTRATEAPRLLEFLLGFVGSIATPAATAIYGLLFHCGAYWLTRLGLWILSQYNREPRIDPSSTAFWVSLFVVAVMGLAGVVPTVQTVATQLYPQTAGLRSAFYPLAAFRRLRAFATLSGTLLLVVAFLLIALLVPGVSGSWWFNFLFAWALVVVGVPLQQFGRSQEPSEELTDSESIRAIKELFEAGDYKVVASPRTGREDIDPLLVTTPDLYAETPERGFAIEVKTAADAAEASDWKLSDLSSAAWALGEYFKEESTGQSKPVDPLLVLVGIDPPASVEIYQKNGLLRVLSIEHKMLDEFFKTKDKEKRAEMARQHLQVPEVPSTLSRPA